MAKKHKMPQYKTYKITFIIESKLEKHIETVKIEASSEESAHTGAFKTKILPKYHNKGYRYYIVETEVLDV